MEWFKKNRKIVIGVLIILVLLVGGLAIILLGNGVKQTKDTITVEAGEELNLKATDFLDISKKKADDVSIDTSEVDTTQVGEYQVVATYKDNKYTIKVVVKDTKAPIVELKESVVTISDFAELKDALFVDTVYDASKYETSFAGYKKVAELSELNDEFVAVLEKGVNDLEDVELATEVPTEEGIYRSALKFTDKYENETLVNVYIVFDSPDPVVEEEVKNETTVTQSEPNSNSDKGNSGNKNNTSNKNTNSGSTTNNSNSTTNSGNSGSTTNNGSANNSISNSNNGQQTNTSGRPLTVNQSAVRQAGYYKVVQTSEGYAVMVHGGEGVKGEQLLLDYLKPLGYYGLVTGSWIDNSLDQYGCYVSYSNLRKIETEDNIVWD